MINSNGGNGGFLKGGYKNCPSCGELMLAENDRCRYCNWVEEEEVVVQELYRVRENVVRPPPSREVPVKSDPVSELPEPDINREPCYTTDGLCIPSEYGPEFSPRSYSWAALWFADLWYAEKGMLKKAMKHFYYRAATAVFGIFAVIHMVGVSDLPDKKIDEAAELGGLLMLLWFVGFVITALVSHNDAARAHRIYTDQYNEAIEFGDHDNLILRGRRLYWAMLLVPFAVFVCGFLFAVAASSGK